jgi:apolipoprotein N-acyltransferase
MVVQGNIPADEKWLRGISASWAVYDSLTRGGAYLHLDLVVWPETALPATLIQQSIYADKLSALADQTGAAIITGASDYCRVNGERKPLNACFLARPLDGIVARDAKRTLVPFGERVPFQWLFPRLGNLNFGQAEFRPGFFTPTNFEAAADSAVIRFPVMVCFESAFPKWSRLAAQSGANLLVTVSNDAWYGRSSEPAQIAALSRFRCIETRRAMARASNSGVSFLCDQLGREIASTPLYQPAAIAAELPLVTAQTFYTRHGETFLAIATCVFGMGVLFAALTSRRRRKTDISSHTLSPLD